MMELFVRLAEEKYILQLQKTKSMMKAVSLFWEEHVRPKISEYDPQAWRKKNYWTVEINNILKHYKPVLDYLYHVKFK